MISVKRKETKNAHVLGLLKARPIWGTFTDGQKLFFELFFQGKNILLTGPAGTGKSYCLNALFSFLDTIGSHYGKTATTGVAALNIGGSTVHSWMGIGLGDDNGEALLMRVEGNKKACTRIKQCKYLFIDEISMAKAELIDKISCVCQYIRNNGDPFGGIQIVFCGDALQLPPVFKRFEPENFVFDSMSWKESDIHVLELTEVIRQSDVRFSTLLNELRVGNTANLSLLDECINRKFPDDGIQPVRLFCKNYDVNKYNIDQLNLIPASEKTYTANDSGMDAWKEFIEKNCIAPKELKLKVGAQVMLLWNLNTEGGLVNGSLGKVVNMFDGLVEVLFVSGAREMIEPQTWEISDKEVVNGVLQKKVLASRRQIPLKLAYATSIHKIQGATLDRAEVDVSDAFADGQVYVALSRVRSLDGLRITRLDATKIRANKKCLNFYAIEKRKLEDRLKQGEIIE